VRKALAVALPDKLDGARLLSPAASGGGLPVAEKVNATSPHVGCRNALPVAVTEPEAVPDGVHDALRL